MHTPDNWGDRTLASAKLTYYPLKGFKLLSSFNHSRNQYSISRLNMNYFLDGIVNETTLPDRAWDAANGDYQVDGLWTAYIPQGYARRVRTGNLLTGFDWDFLQKTERNATLQFRYTRFRTQEVGSAQLRDNYVRGDNVTFGNWSMHDIPFEVETMPGMNLPLEGTPEAHLYYPDGAGAVAPQLGL